MFFDGCRETRVTDQIYRIVIKNNTNNSNDVVKYPIERVAYVTRKNDDSENLDFQY